ncbi:hypothetical protein, partial [uncultured Christiangramia sp.]|uniref:hypothetical protein n=1 Tax=uncultured Christiangramia sp. TaxID=503836 RepID=UPI00260D379C
CLTRDRYSSPLSSLLKYENKVKETVSYNTLRMKKTCFVIMPISDSSNYEKGHFERVYDFIIKPACISAGFEPVRADDVLTTNHID